MRKSRMRDRLSNKVNAGSMADIAFLLLIFFLVTTTIKEDTGLMVRLPPWTQDPPPTDVAKRNVFRILINADNELVARNERIDISELKDKIKLFLSNPHQDENLAKDPSKAIVSLMNDRATSYTTYVEVYNEIKRAYNELRKEKAQTDYGIPYDKCSAHQRKSIHKAIPLVISEAEPSDYADD